VCNKIGAARVKENDERLEGEEEGNNKVLFGGVGVCSRCEK